MFVEGREKIHLMEEKKTFIIGHKNPDTDSICSAVSYAELKNILNGGGFEARRAGQINEETKFVLNYFDIEEPKLISSVKTQIKDIDIKKTKGVNSNITLKKAWSLMSGSGAVTTLPAVNDNNELVGIITVGDIAKSYMNIHDSRILSMAKTRYSNIIETLDGKIVVGDDSRYFDKGKVLIAAANPDRMEHYIEEDDLVILGNRYESQLCAIEMGASCIIVCDGSGVSKTIQKLAKERDTVIITTEYDTFMAARLITQSMPISFFMTDNKIVTFNDDEYLDDIKDTMANFRYRDFPVLDKNGFYKGMISRRNLLGAKGKNIILVDHNERAQAVDGMDSANILEIIDHHRLGTVETVGPVYFRAQPLGCTSTIVYQMYKENNIEIPKKIAGLLCSAIISDTLLFRSPTCTMVDELACKELASIAGLELEKYANDMFAAAGNLSNKTDEEILNQDFKKFKFGNIKVGIGQISSINNNELDELEERLIPYIKNIKDDLGQDMIFFMLTSIIEQSTRLILIGNGAVNLINSAFGNLEEFKIKNNEIAYLKGIVSRKKQLVPSLLVASQI